jgi:hypothetical protein
LDKEKQKEILKRFSNLSDPIVSDLYGIPFWSSTGVQTNILAKSNGKHFKNKILMDSIKELQDESKGESSSQSNQQTPKKKLKEVDIITEAEEEFYEHATFSKNVIFFNFFYFNIYINFFRFFILKRIYQSIFQHV